MSTQLQQPFNLPIRIILWFLVKTLPRAIRQECLEFLEERCESLSDWLRESIGALRKGYTDQFILGVSQFGLALEILAAVYCLSAAGLARPLVLMLGVLVLWSMLRTAYTNPLSRFGSILPKRWQNSTDSVFDAVVAMLLLVLCEATMLKISLQLTLSPAMFFRGAFILVLLLATIRMVFRKRLQPDGPFKGSNMTAEEIYKRTWWLNVLWIFACQSMIITNPHSLPDWVPEHDFLRTVIPMKMFVIWFRIQQNALIRRDKIETLFGNWEKKKLARLREVLIKGMEKGEPLYAWYVGLQGALFLYLSIPLLVAVWPWLAGGETPVDVFSVMFHVAMLITLAWSWNYLKDANRMAADAMQERIDAMDVAFAVA